MIEMVNSTGYCLKRRTLIKVMPYDASVNPKLGFKLQLECNT